MNKESDVTNILAIDGGGIRGIIPAMVLAEIECRTQKPIAELFKLIAGTSTGGILALGLTVKTNSNNPKLSAQELVQLYKEEGNQIFSRSIWRRIRGVGDKIDEKYSAEGLEELLDKHLGTARLKDSSTDVIVTSYEIERRTPWFFKSRNARDKPATHDFFMKDVARATTAAPTYFEPARIDTRNNNYYALIDGAVFANNPSMCAYIEAQEAYNAKNIRVVSLGTGVYTKSIPYKEAKGWGKFGWAHPILNTVFDGVSDTVDYQMSKLLNEDKRYYRFQVRLSEDNEDMDNAGRDNIRALQLLAEDLIRRNDNKLNELCEELTR